MDHADRLLDDEAVVAAIFQALGRRHPRSRTRGRRGSPAEIVLRLLILKHVRNWSYEVLEREVRANLVYRDFTRVGGGKMPDAKTIGRWGLAVGPEAIKQVHERLVRMAFGARVAAKDARPSLLHHLPHPRHHLLKLLTQAFQGELPSDAVRPLDPVSDLTGEPLRLTDHPAGRGEQSAVALPKPRLALRSLGACRPRNIEHAQFDAPAAVAKPRADLAGDGGDLLHRPDQHPYAVPEQA